MRNLLSFAMALGMVFLAWSADGATATKKKKGPVKKGATSSATRKKSATGKKSGTTTASARGKKGATATKRSATTWRNRQLSPSPDRYREIQQALASKGYLSAEEANGAWGPGSAEALKRFQADQNIEPSGKINSLSLIALGLGPKREPVAASPGKAPEIKDNEATGR